MTYEALIAHLCIVHLCVCVCRHVCATFLPFSREGTVGAFGRGGREGAEVLGGMKGGSGDTFSGSRGGVERVSADIESVKDEERNYSTESLNNMIPLPMCTKEEEENTTQHSTETISTFTPTPQGTCVHPPPLPPRPQRKREYRVQYSTHSCQRSYALCWCQRGGVAQGGAFRPLQSR